MNRINSVSIFLKSALFSTFLNCTLVCAVNAGVENRPINTDDAYTLDKGVFNLSLGATLVDRETGLNLNFGYGLTDRFEFTVDIPVGLPALSLNNEETLGDISIRPEFLLIEEADYIPAFSLAYTIAIKPNLFKDREGGYKLRENIHSVSLQISKDIDRLTCHFNVGYSYENHPNGEALNNSAFYNLACEYSFKNVSLVGELTGETNSDPNSKVNLLECLVGFAYSINDRLTMDFGLGGGLTTVSPDYRATMGITLSF